MSPQRAGGESQRPLYDIMRDQLLSPARSREFLTHRGLHDTEESIMQNQISRKIRYSVYRGKYQPILTYPFKQPEYVHGLNWCVKALFSQHFFTGGSFDRLYALRSGLRMGEFGMDSEYNAVSSQLVAEESTFCGIVIKYRAYIGGSQTIMVYDTVVNDFCEPIQVPEWVLKMVAVSPNHILCGLRTGILIIIDIEKKKIVA